MSSDEQGQKRIIQGIVTGIVKKNWDESEKHPGMVEVEINLGEDEKLLTDWVRVAQPYAGDGYGAYWLPEEGDEVLLAFHMGDLNNPYVIGSLWGGARKIPLQTVNACNTVKRIKTKGGHEIVFSSEKDKERLEINTPKELKITLEDETQTILVQNQDGKNMLKINGKDGEIEITAENAISFNSSSGGASLKLDGSQKKATLKADTISLESQQCLQMKVEGMLELKSGASLSVKSGGVLELKGALIEIN